MMNFRQRIGWTGMGLYLLASLAALYYLFEINWTYNGLPLDYVGEAAKEPSDPVASSSVSWVHSFPLWLWMMIFLIPYIQVFLFLYSCTRPDPRTVGYCILPIFLAMLCNRHQTFAKASNQISRLQLIDT